MKMTGGEAIISAMMSHDVNTIFTLPGAQNDWLFNALHDINASDASDASDDSSDPVRVVRHRRVGRRSRRKPLHDKGPALA